MRTTAGLLDLFVTISINDEASKGLDDVAKKGEKIGDSIGKGAASGGSGLKGLESNGIKSANSLKEAFGGVAKTLAAAFTAKKIVEFGVATVKSASDAQAAFAKVNTLLSSGTDTTAYFDSIKQASLETGVAIGDFSEAVYSAISASVDQANAVDFTTNAVKLAKGGFTDTATAVDVLTTAINAYGLKASDATRISDILITTQNLGKTTVGELAQAMGRVIPTANSFGVNLETLAASYAVMTKNGIATAESTTYLNGMLNELGKSGSKAANALKKGTGKSFKELMESGKSLGEVLEILQDEAKKAGVAVGDMFGSQEAGKAANTLIDHADDLVDSLNAMQNSAGSAESAYQTMAGTLQEQFQILKNKWDLFKESLGEKILPGVTEGVKYLAGHFDDVAAAAENCAIVIGSTLAGVAIVKAIAMFNQLKEAADKAFSAAAAGQIGGVATGTALAIGSVAAAAGAYGVALNQNNKFVEKFSETTKVSASSYEEAAKAMAGLQQEMDNLNDSYEAGEEWSKKDERKWDELRAKYNNYQKIIQEGSYTIPEAVEESAEAVDRFQTATDEYVSAATNLMQQYQATYEATLSSVEKWFGPFEKAGTKVTTTFEQIKANMQSQIDFNNQYSENLQYLADNGLGSLGDALQSYGADGAAYAAAIVEQLQSVGGATSEAGQAVVENLTSLMDGMAESQHSVAQSLSQMGGDLQAQMQQISEQYAEAIEGLDKSQDAMEKAKNTISAFVNGLSSSKGGIMSTMGDIGSQMTSALQASLGNVTMTVTANLVMKGGGGGRAIGLDYVPYNEYPAMLHRGEAVLNSYEADQWRRGRSGVGGSGITINQNIHSVPQSPIQLAAATQAMFEQARWAM